jgi:fumarate reductase flavoprotein subunit
MYRIREGHATPNGGVYLRMAHLGPAEVQRQFKGMVERCADCGFDLAGGDVEVVPTAHYMMGGVVFDTECRTPMPRLYAAGEDTGGVHGANRLGGNGVANSTVFGAIAGGRMAEAVGRERGALADCHSRAIDAGLGRAYGPIGRAPGDLFAMREELLELMWDQVGILRTGAGLQSAAARLDALASAVRTCGIADGDRRFNLTWMDRLNVENLIEISRAICAASLARDDSRGAHFREDFPETSDLDGSSYTMVRSSEGRLQVDMQPVHFTRVRPGESLLLRDVPE